MAPKKQEEIAIMHLIYDKDTSSTDVKKIDIKDSYLHQNHLKETGDWLRHVVFFENLQMPSNLALRLCEFGFRLSNKDIFTINGTFYEKIFFVICGDTNYWIYFNDEQSHAGFGDFSLTTCVCCLPSQLLPIATDIKQYIESRK